ncbi:alpha/beta fold hydrolase [Actinoplanes sp. NPDC026619]|uniref:alpha/beta hydrolase family protein n=1 Tax=Actinoplanes sp. NPDC026619 TaxID=3155798 RepID=UPI0033F176DF
MTGDFPADLRPAASTPAVTFASGGELLPGVLHLPAGPGPFPVVVLLHGFPGNERNFDLAQALRRAGYAALVFHYRGSWGAGGTWSWAHVLEDAATVVTQVRADARLDPSRVAVAGHSAGGFAALRTAAADPAVGAVASLAGFDLAELAAATHADPGVRADWVTAFDQELLPLRGTSGEALVAEAETAGDAWRLTGLAPSLAGRPVLLIGAGRDPLSVPAVHHDPLVAAYASARLEHHVFPTDHALSDHRLAAAATLIAFLDRHLVASGSTR